MFLKHPKIIIIGFGKNNVLCPKYIDLYEFFGGDIYGPPYIICSLFQKKRKSTRA